MIFLCTLCYGSAIEQFNNVNSVTYLTSVDSNEGQSIRASADAALCTIPSLSNDGILESPHNSSSSDNSDEGNMEFESSFNNEMSLELLK